MTWTRRPGWTARRSGSGSATSLLPQLVPVIALLAVLRFIFTFNKFDDVYLLTGGGAGTEVVSVRVYDFLTARKDVGLAAAQAVVLAAGPDRADRRLPAGACPGRQGGRAMTAVDGTGDGAGRADPVRRRARSTGRRSGAPYGCSRSCSWC